MGGATGGGDDEIVDINITPFVDIVLVVLIIFMVTATYIAKQAIQVNLPDAATGEQAHDISLAVTIDAARKYHLDGKPITEQGLRDAVRAAKQKLAEQAAPSRDPSKPAPGRTASTKAGDVVVLIAADQTVPHGTVIHLVDVVRQEGVSKFFFNIEPVDLPAGAPGADGSGAAPASPPRDAKPDAGVTTSP